MYLWVGGEGPAGQGRIGRWDSPEFRLPVIRGRGRLPATIGLIFLYYYMQIRGKGKKGRL